MGSEDTLIGNDWKVMLGDGQSPEEFADVCAAFDFGQVGEEKPLVDVTAYCDEARADRNGLADGVEIPLQCNFIPGDTQLRAIYDAYKADELVRIRVARKDQDSSPDEYFEFSSTVRAWNVSGPIGEKSVLTFTLKISGEVLWVT
jgi:hypothetical protein